MPEDREEPLWILQARNDLIQGALDKFIHASTLPELRMKASCALGHFGRHMEAEHEGLFDLLDYPELERRFSELKAEFIEDIIKFLKERIR